MPSWILLTAIAQFINAGVALVDKYIVTSRTIARPVVYAFYATIFSAFALVVFLFNSIDIPFINYSLPTFSNVSTPNLTIVLWSILAAIGLLSALIFLFSALKKADASDVVPVVGSFTAIFVLIWGYFLLASPFSINFVWGFMLLVFGTLLISHFRFGYRIFFLTLLSALFFSVNVIAIKLLFIENNFDNAFFWLHLADLVVPLVILLIPKYFHRILSQPQTTGAKGGALVIVNKILSGIAGFLLLNAIAIGNPALVQALAGLQFVYLFIFSIIFGNFTHHHFGENVSFKDAFQKFISIAIIVIGFVVLFI